MFRNPAQESVEQKEDAPAFRPIGILNFNGVIKQLDGQVGYEGVAPGTPGFSVYWTGKKPGGSDVGHLVEIDTEPFIVKTGVSTSLLGQVLKHVSKGEKEKEIKKLGFIAGDFFRIVGATWDENPVLRNVAVERGIDTKSVNFKKFVTDEVQSVFNQFKQTEEGIALIQKLAAKQELTTKDVQSIQLYLASHSPILREVISVTTFSDIIKGACGQFFSNSFQETQAETPRSVLDEQRVLIESGEDPNIFMASRFNKQALAFDQFLLAPFIESADQCGEDKKVWIDECAKKLSQKLGTVQGLCSAIFIRHLMGEKGDLGPDNMLLIPTGKDSYSVMNIDVTGFRYARRQDYLEEGKPPALGWEGTLQITDSKQLAERLLNDTVFSNRFVKDSEKLPKGIDKIEVMKAIVSILKDRVGNNAAQEIQAVREWLISQDSALASISLDKVIRNTHAKLKVGPRSFSKEALDALSNSNEKFLECIEAARNALEVIKVNEKAPAPVVGA